MMMMMMMRSESVMVWGKISVLILVLLLLLKKLEKNLRKRNQELAEQVLTQNFKKSELVSSGIQNVSTFSFFPRFSETHEEQLVDRTTRSTLRAITPRSSYFLFLPLELFHVPLFEEMNRKLQQAHALNQQRAKEDDQNPNSIYRPMSWREYWKLLAAHFYSIATERSSIEALYTDSPTEQLSIFPAKKRFKALRPLLQVKNITLRKRCKIGCKKRK
jgi:hypothetical protein